ncbi:TlpA disulfide reductase family protein [Flavobacterium sp. ST-87]|uniref:TlpA disulfide reductase family protein n=1 Tax=Flavobacterium plantiphilum TaxID=3163297 RepID=A0ABW8XRT0_9FLAO
MKKNTLLILCIVSMIANAQDKKIWAKSFINKQAPELIVEKWISEQPYITKDKFILIDFWASWCGPCKRAIPKLNNFQKEFKDDLIIIGISDEPEPVVKNQTNPAIEYFNAIDTKKRLYNIFEVTGIPHCVIINPAGVVVWEGFPYLQGHELTSDVIKNLISESDKLILKNTTEANISKYSSLSIGELNDRKTELELEANYILVNDYLEQIEREDVNHMALTKIDHGIVTSYWENATELKSYYKNWKEAVSKISAFEREHAPELQELSTQFKNKTIDKEVYLRENRTIRNYLSSKYPNEYTELSTNHIRNLKTMWKATARYMLEDYKKQKKTFPVYWIPENDRVISEKKKKYSLINQEIIAVQNEIKKRI